MSDAPKQTSTTEAMARAVCKAWGLDPDARSYDGTDGTFSSVNWLRQDVQRAVKAFCACMEAISGKP